ncbi:hypothetical protein HT102_13155 [Hoyosella sp. G463]|uniref:Uncharacterized protein n=1 Tax=Lolliginicoccus lacisalsi TaxID=2742202 RepID=A0A927JDS1_9ACTN|nr:hypothetical protein [Lolliginicoccus lacisalsi]MBD8507431.1 hypothetical protein [Lolliginicoccus lacisalsi]
MTPFDIDQIQAPSLINAASQQAIPTSASPGIEVADLRESHSLTRFPPTGNASTMSSGHQVRSLA